MLITYRENDIPDPLEHPLLLSAKQNQQLSLINSISVLMSIGLYYYYFYIHVQTVPFVDEYLKVSKRFKLAKETVR